MTLASDPRFKNKSPDYVRGWLEGEARLAAGVAATPMRNDAAPNISRGEFREDTAPRPAMVPAAARAKAAMLSRDCHVRQDDALNRAGLLSHADRDAETRRVIAERAVLDQQWRIETNRKLIASGQAPLRLDSADAPLAGAAAAKMRMQVRSDSYCHDRTSPEERPDYRTDAAPSPRNSSAADARARLYNQHR